MPLNNALGWRLGVVMAVAVVAAFLVLPYCADIRHERDLAFPESAHQWQQPVALVAAFPQLVSRTQWQLDFTPLEQTLWRALQQHGDAGIAEPWLTTLDNMIDVLPESVSPRQWQRIQFLLTKGAPGQRGRQLAEVLPRYQRYRMAYSELMQQPPRYSGVEQLAFRQHQIRQLRTEILGQVWDQRLFSAQEKTAQYLLKRLQIRTDTALDETQRQRQLRMLDHEHRL